MRNDVITTQSPKYVTGMAEKLATYTLLAVAIVSLFAVPADDSPAWFLKLVASKVLSALCFATAAWLVKREKNAVVL